MKNITVSVTDIVYMRVRVWAAEHETSVSAVVAYLLRILPTHKAAGRHFSAPQSPAPATTAVSAIQQNTGRPSPIEGPQKPRL